MIVEFLGIPGSGKSTLAHLVAACFEDQGYPVRLPRAYNRAAWARLLIWIQKFIKVCRFAITDPNEFHNTLHILRLLPQKDILSFLRMLQYCLYLLSIRQKCKDGGSDIFIFDQGFAQLIYSLALFSDQTEDETLARVMRMLPKPDVVIALHVPAGTLLGRLDKRKRKGRLEREIRSSSQAIQDSIYLVTKIDSILSKSGVHVLHYDEHESTSISQATDDVFHMLWCVVTQTGSLGERGAHGSATLATGLADSLPQPLRQRL